MTDHRKPKRFKNLLSFLSPLVVSSSDNVDEVYVEIESVSGSRLVTDNSVNDIGLNFFPSIPLKKRSESFDINSLQCDPGLHQPISSHAIDMRDRIRKDYVVLGPYQPCSSFYPLSFDGGQGRKFNPKWFKQWPWLEYSEEKDKAFCFPCFLFVTYPSHHPAFTVDGFNGWKNSSQEITDNRLRLITSIESARLLAHQGCAFRGHDEAANSPNGGNFDAVVNSFGRVSLEVSRVTKNAPGNAKYTAPSIQKKIVNILGNKVRKKIRDEVGVDKFCILVDEAVDVANREQMAIILRFVDCHGFITERFIKVLSVNDTCSQTLKDEITKVLIQNELQVEDMRGQGYDGASNMRAKGVHSISGFFSTLNMIVNFVDSSAKRHSTLRDIRKEEIVELVAAGTLKTGSWLNQSSTLQQAGATRWGSHLRSISSLIKLFGATRTTCRDLVISGPNKYKMKHVVFSKLQDMRDNGWDALIMKVISFCCEYDILIPDMSAPYKKGIRAYEQDITIEQFYRVNVFYDVIDFQLVELNSRFPDDSMELLVLSATFDPHNNFQSFRSEDVHNLASRFYPADFTSYELLVLDMECGYFLADIQMDSRFANITSVSDLCRRLVVKKISILSYDL
ncbi:uncharacterized protein LOC126803567 [Argentina anserina]|uniref:uncharacterized protein LOC126803567 n=1 Tax=Argentina anserina TaxID=57926 RepID=UPI002176571C|nr:uncharacterized protein LOC126803567 [Potentilla anserina]